MRKRKIIMISIIMLMSVALLAGCNFGNIGGDGGGSGYKPVVEPGTDGKITKEPLELTIFLHMGGLGAFEDDYPYFQEAFEKTNIKLRGTANKSNVDRTQEYNIMLTSEPLPDIIQAMKTEINRDAVNGSMIPLDDLIDEYAPNFKKMLEEEPSLRAQIEASDGKIYFFPHLFTGLPSEGFYIRQDWLDKLGLEVPKTVDEYYNMLKAFREQDPNGNGEKDEVPYFSRGGNADGLLQLWNAFGGFQAKDGKVVHGRTQPQYRNAIENMAKWYAEGLIDQEIFSRGQKAREQLLGSNVGGATHDWFSSCGSFNKLASQIPGFKWVAIPPPADVNGVVKETSSRHRMNGWGWGISKDNKYPVETIKYFDFWMSPEGQRLYSYGVEGVDYTLDENGKPVVSDVVKNAPESGPMYLRSRGQQEFGAVMLIEAELEIMNEYAREGYKMYWDNGWCEVVPQFPPLTFTQEEERIIKEKGTPITTYFNEQRNKWVMGTEKLTDESWNAYLNQLKIMGIDEYVKVYQDAYDRYMASQK